MISKLYRLYKQFFDHTIGNNTVVVLLIVMILFGTVSIVSYAENKNLKNSLLSVAGE